MLAGGAGVWNARQAEAAEPKPDTRSDQLSAISDYVGKVNTRQSGDAAVAQYEAEQGIAGRLKAAEADFSKMSKPTKGVSSEADVDKYAAQEKLIEGLKAQEKATHQLTEEQKQVDALLERSRERELTGLQKVNQERLHSLELLGKTPAMVAEINKAYDNMARTEEAKLYLANKKRVDEFNLANDRASQEAATFSDRLAAESSKNGFGAWRDELKFGGVGGVTTTLGQATEVELPQIAKQATSQDLLRSLNNEERYQEQLIKAQGDKSPQEQFERQSQLSDLRERTAQRVLELETNIAQLKDTESARDQAIEDAQIKFEQRKFDIRLENEAKIAEIQEKQLETIKSSTEKLFEVLFTKPKNFGKDLEAELRAAVLKPAVDAASSSVASILQPIIYGKEGKGGISGALHPVSLAEPLHLNSSALDRNREATERLTARLSSFRAASEQNTDAVKQHSAVTAVQTAVDAASAGITLPSATGTVGITPPSVTAGSSTRRILDFSSGYTASSPSAGGSAPVIITGGDYSAAGGDGLPMSSVRSVMPDVTGASSWTDGSAAPSYAGNARSGGGFNVGGLIGTAATLLGAGQPGAKTQSQGVVGQLSGLAKNFKQTNWGSFTRSTPVSTPQYDDQGNYIGDSTQAGRITGVGGVAGAGLMMGGTALATAGLMGERRGTWGGVAEGAAGGAMIGMQMGGPIGAAIGAGVGFAVGVGEMLAGDISPRRKWSVMPSRFTASVSR